MSARWPEVVARADAPVDRAWALLGDLTRLAEWEPRVARVECAGRGPLVGGERVVVVPAGPLGRLPTSLRRIPVDVGLVDPPAELGLVVHVGSGLVERVRMRLLALPGGRTDCELRARLSGPFAPLCRGPARLGRGVAVRRFAAAAGRAPEARR